MQGMSLLSELQLVGEDAVGLYHEMELLPHESHEIQNMMWTVKPTFLHSFLKFKFKRSDYELPCFLHLMTANREGWSLRNALMRLLFIRTLLESAPHSHNQQHSPTLHWTAKVVMQLDQMMSICPFQLNYSILFYSILKTSSFTHFLYLLSTCVSTHLPQILSSSKKEKARPFLFHQLNSTLPFQPSSSIMDIFHRPYQMGT